jgi:predicted transglutaminase-like cysteine proteinase
VHKFTFPALIALPLSAKSSSATHQKPSIRTLFQRCLTALLLLLTAWCVAATLDPNTLQQQLVARFGPARVPLLKDWQQIVATAKPLADEAKLKRINDFFNQNVAFDDDINIWQQSDYWATPLETIGKGRGDCEDFAIAKYYTLRLAGMPVSKMRLIYVKAKLKTPTGMIQQAHMVLAYYATPNAEPQVLDNLDTTIRAASQRSDLQPVFSFNSEGIFAGVSGKEKASAGGTSRLSRWEDLMQRARADGFD